MANRHFKSIQEPEFRLIKTMTDAGIKTGLVVKATKRSWLVVEKIKQSGTLEEYKRNITSYCNAHDGKHKQSEPVKEAPVAGHYPRIVALLDTIVTRQIAMQEDIDRIKGRLLIIK